MTTPTYTKMETWPGDHIVRFYDKEDSLYSSVTPFLRDGLDRGEGVVIIATEDHRHGFEQALASENYDVRALKERGQLLLVDAQETLAKLMSVSGLPDPELFRRVVGRLFEDASARCGGARVRAYGEMVDLLLQQGYESATFRLEELWNVLAEYHAFHLCCAYRLGNFHHARHSEPFQAICDLHSRVFPADSFEELKSPDEQHRLIADLQRRSRALEAEIAEGKEIERALRQREGELNDFLETAAEGLHWVGSDGTILWANQAGLDMLGFLREEYVGHHISEFHADHEVIDDILARLGRNERLRDCEARMRAKDGSIRHVLINSSVHWEGGRFAHSRCFTRDITQQKNLELALRAEQEHLLEANRRKDEFLAMLSHELRNPLTPILNALEIMDLRDEDESRKERDVIRRQAKHLAGLVDDLLDLSRVAGGKITLRREPMELGFVVANAIEMASPLLEDRAHTLRVSVPAKGLPLQADPIRLPQVFANLLVNAAKYTEPGGRLSITAYREDGEIITEIRDNGVGIAPDALATIFEPFVQGDRSLDRSQGGLGLGLALVRRFTELHEGSVSAHSEGKGKGSRFVVRLPALKGCEIEGTGKRAKASGAPASAARPARSERVLVVDDNADSALTFAEVIRRLGHEAEVAYEGPQAIAAARAFQPTLALVDIGLPEMDGYELARKLREVANRHPLRLVAVTGYGEEADRVKSREAGFDAHAVKPVDLKTLRDLLDGAGAPAPLWAPDRCS